MNNLYDLHSYSKHYREEARKRHVIERARAGCEPGRLPP
jgi:hypothetical protein